MSRIILHAGTHKTATSTIQRSLGDGRALAARHGLVYPDLRNGHHGLCLDWIALPEIYRYPEGSRAAWEGIVARHAGGDRTVLVSSEELSRGTRSMKVDFAQLRGWLKPFDEVEIVCFLREQVSLIQSVFLEIARKWPNFAWGKHLRHGLNVKLGAGVHLDFGALYDDLLTGFDASEITFLPFRPGRADGHDPLGRLLHHIGHGALDAEIARHDTNVSGDPLATWLAGLIDERFVGDPAVEARIRALYGARRSVMYTRSEYLETLKTFAPLNAAFLARYPDMGADDLKLADRDPEDVFYRNEFGPGFAARLARTMMERERGAEA